MQLVSRIHGITIMKTRRKDRKTNLEKKNCTLLSNKINTSSSQIRQTSTWVITVLRNCCQIVEKYVLYWLNCALFNAFFVYRTLNKNKNKGTIASCTRQEGPGYQKSGIQLNQFVMTFRCLRSKQHKGRLNRTHQISEYTNWKKLLLMGMEERSILQVIVKCVLHVRRKVKLDTFVNSALFHFTNCPFLRNTTQ